MEFSLGETTCPQAAIDAEFTERARQAEECVRANEDAMPETPRAYRHDECLGAKFVYDFLTARSYLQSRATMLSELHWMERSVPPTPVDAISDLQFETSRFCVVKALLRRFEHGPYLAIPA